MKADDDVKLLEEDELQLLRAIATEEINGLATTYRKLQQLTGRKSPYSVQILVTKLSGRGYVLITPGAARAIRLTRKGLAAVTGSMSGLRALPILGVRRSSYSAWADEGAVETFPVPGDAFEPSADFLMVAAGHATFPARGIFDGDLIAVQRTLELRRQALFVRAHAGELWVGNALPKDDGWKLVGVENTWEDGAQDVVGRVVGVLRTRVTARKRVSGTVEGDALP